MKTCTTIEELENELAILNRRMSAILSKLNSFASNNASATRDDVIETRQQWMEVKAEQLIRTYELEESLPFGVVTTGSRDRAVARICCEAEAAEGVAA
jgi:hypothetical protein